MARLPKFTASGSVPSTTGVTSIPRTDLKLGVMGAAFSKVGAATNQLGMTLLQDAAEDHADNAALGAQVEIITAKTNIEQNSDPLKYVDNTLNELDTIYAKATKGMSQFSKRRFDQRWNTMAASAISAAQINMVKRGREKSEGALITFMDNALTGAAIPGLEDANKKQIFDAVMQRVEEKRASGIIDDPKAAKLMAKFKQDFSAGIVASWIGRKDLSGTADAIISMQTGNFGATSEDQLAKTFWNNLGGEEQGKILSDLSTRRSRFISANRAEAAALKVQQETYIEQALVQIYDKGTEITYAMNIAEHLSQMPGITGNQIKAVQEFLEGGGVVHSDAMESIVTGLVYSGRMSADELADVTGIDDETKAALFKAIPAARGRSAQAAIAELETDPDLLRAAELLSIAKDELTVDMMSILHIWTKAKNDHLFSLDRKKGSFDHVREMRKIMKEYKTEKFGNEAKQLEAAKAILVGFGLPTGSRAAALTAVMKMPKGPDRVKATNAAMRLP
jgi:hypothetical protein